MANGYPPGGALFNNTRKGNNDRAPDVTGNLEISKEVLDHLNDCARRGVEMKMDLSGWKKPTKTGGSFFSLSAKVPYNQQQTQAPPPRQQTSRQPVRQQPSAFDLDDEIPF